MRLIFVVARSQVARLESLRASLVGADDVLIVADRREAERRQPEADGTADAPRRVTLAGRTGASLSSPVSQDAARMKSWANGFTAKAYQLHDVGAQSVRCPPCSRGKGFNSSIVLTKS